MKRPLSVFGFSYFIALGVAFCLPDTALNIICAAAALIFVLTSVLLRNNRRLIAVGALGVLVSIGNFMYVNFTRYYPCQDLVGQSHSIVLEVTEIPDYQNWGTRAKCKVLNETVGDIKGEFYVMMSIYDAPGIRRGDVYMGNIKFDKNYIAQSGADYSRYQNCYISATAAGSSLSRLDTKATMQFLQDLRELITARIRGFVSGDSGDVLCGVCFGDKSYISDEVIELFRLCGASHLLALSGLHLGVFAAALYAIFRLFNTNFRVTAVLSAIVSSLFAVLVGLTPSVCRALILVWYTAIGKCIDRDTDAITVLGFSCVVLTFHNPYAMQNPGLMLSILSCIAIMVILPKFNRTYKHITGNSLPAVLQTVLGSVCVLLVTMAYSLYIFGEVSLAGVLLNVILIPLYSLIIPVGIFGGFAVVLLGRLAYLLQPVFTLIGILCDLSITLLKAVGNFADVYMIAPQIEHALICAAVLIAIYIGLDVLDKKYARS